MIEQFETQIFNHPVKTDEPKKWDRIRRNGR